MHGRLKIKTSAEKEAAALKEKTDKAIKFKHGLKLVLSKRSNGEKDDESMKITAQLLSVNPDVYTLWNFRREIIMERKSAALNQLNGLRTNMDGDSEEKSKLIEEELDGLAEMELSLSEICLLKNPKSYSAWFQRHFVLDAMFKPNLERELQLCNQALLKDDRNFHCWDHRRSISERLSEESSSGLLFTQEKINTNFSNFSSWYYRSCLITELVVSKSNSISDFWQSEYDMVENAIFTDPTDQSAWFYYRWLTLTNFDQLQFKYNRNIHYARIQNTVASSRLIAISMNRQIETFLPQLVCLSVDGNYTRIAPVKVNDHASLMWYATIPTNVDSLISLDVSGPDGSVKIPLSKNSIVIKRFRSEFSSKKGNSFLTEEKRANLVELRNMEPENKWVNLMVTDVLGSGNGNQTETYRKLCHLDPLRTNYYQDMISKNVLESNRAAWSSNVDGQLSNLGLTSIHFVDQMIHLHSLDLSGNVLRKLSSILNDLVFLKVLAVDCNLIDSIDPKFRMVSLEILSLQKNRLDNFSQLSSILQHSSRLVKLLVAGNDFQDQPEENLKSIIVSEYESLPIQLNADLKVIYF